MSIQISISEITLKFDRIKNVDLNQLVFFRFSIKLRIILKSELTLTILCLNFISPYSDSLANLVMKKEKRR